MTKHMNKHKSVQDKGEKEVNTISNTRVSLALLVFAILAISGAFTVIGLQDDSDAADTATVILDMNGKTMTADPADWVKGDGWYTKSYDVGTSLSDIESDIYADFQMNSDGEYLVKLDYDETSLTQDGVSIESYWADWTLITLPIEAGRVIDESHYGSATDAWFRALASGLRYSFNESQINSLRGQTINIIEVIPGSNSGTFVLDIYDPETSVSYTNSGLNSYYNSDPKPTPDYTITFNISATDYHKRVAIPIPEYVVPNDALFAFGPADGANIVFCRNQFYTDNGLTTAAPYVQMSENNVSIQNIQIGLGVNFGYSDTYPTGVNIHYNLNGGEFDIQPKTEYTSLEFMNLGGEIELSVPQRDGMFFCGWYSSENLIGHSVDKVVNMGNHSFHAKWVSNDVYDYFHDGESARKVSILGDSISTYYNQPNCTDPEYTSTSTDGWGGKYPDLTVDLTWWMRLLNDVGADLVADAATSGAGFFVSDSSNLFYKDSFINRLSYNSTDPEIILIHGFRDYKTVLDWNEVHDESEDYTLNFEFDQDSPYANGSVDGDPDNLVAAVALTFNKILNKYPQAQVVVIEPFTRLQTDETDDVYAKYVESTAIWRAMLASISDYYGFPHVSLGSIEWTTDDVPDLGAHPNVSGMSKMSNLIEEQMGELLAGNKSYIVFDSNSDANYKSVQSVPFDEETPLQPYMQSGLVYANHGFRGWATASDSTDVDYEDKASVQNLAPKGYRSVLYAVWSESEITSVEIEGSYLPTTYTGLNQDEWQDHLVVKSGEVVLEDSEYDVFYYTDASRTQGKTENAKDAMHYYVEIVPSATSSYGGVINSIDFEIQKAPLTLTPQNITLTYGDAVPGWAQSMQGSSSVSYINPQREYLNPFA